MMIKVHIDWLRWELAAFAAQIARAADAVACTDFAIAHRSRSSSLFAEQVGRIERSEIRDLSVEDAGCRSLIRARRIDPDFAALNPSYGSPIARFRGKQT
jgi:hypothetical protein